MKNEEFCISVKAKFFILFYGVHFKKYSLDENDGNTMRSHSPPFKGRGAGYAIASYSTGLLKVDSLFKFRKIGVRS